MGKIINNQFINSIIKTVLDEKNIRTYLDIVASCHHLSYINQLLVYEQHPTSKMIMGKVAWENMGAAIKPESHPIALLYPSILLKHPGEPVVDADGDCLCEKGTGTCLYIKDPLYANNYTIVYAFDISHTNRFDNGSKNKTNIDFIDRIKYVTPLTVSYVDKDELLYPHEKGQFVESEQEIQILKGLESEESNAIAIKAYVDYYIENQLMNSNTCKGEEYNYNETIKLLCRYCIEKYFSLNTNKQYSFIFINALASADNATQRKVLQKLSEYVSGIIQELSGWYLTFNESAIANSILSSESYSELASSLVRVGDSIKSDRSLFQSLTTMTFKILHSEAGYLSQLYYEKENQSLYSFPPYPINVDSRYYDYMAKGEPDND